MEKNDLCLFLWWNSGEETEYKHPVRERKSRKGAAGYGWQGSGLSKSFSRWTGNEKMYLTLAINQMTDCSTRPVGVAASPHALIFAVAFDWGAFCAVTCWLNKKLSALKRWVFLGEMTLSLLFVEAIIFRAVFISLSRLLNVYGCCLWPVEQGRKGEELSNR